MSKIDLTDPKIRSTHMQLIGPAGRGKSRFLADMIKSDIQNNNGLCLIDPHGHLFDDILRWCETERFLDGSNQKNILLFDPAEPTRTLGFNPLHVDTPDLSYHVDVMVNACVKVWGEEDTLRKPLLQRTLHILFHILAEKKLTLLDGLDLIDPQNKTAREHLTQNIANPLIQQEWAAFNSVDAKSFYEQFASTINRMNRFLGSPIIRNIIGQTENVIDFEKIMDEGSILLVNLASKDQISEENARLLGTLLVNDIFVKAKGRPEGSKSFYLYIDNGDKFINEHIAWVLNKGPKLGLFLILAHQHLAQLKQAGEDIYQSIMANTKTKLVFGQPSRKDAEVLANYDVITINN